jgi:hypothetical protein
MLWIAAQVAIATTPPQIIWGEATLSRIDNSVRLTARLDADAVGVPSVHYRLHRAGALDRAWTEPLADLDLAPNAAVDRPVALALGAEHLSNDLPTWLEARITWITDDLREAQIWTRPIVVHGPEVEPVRTTIGGVRVLDSATAWTADDRPTPSAERVEVEDAGN